MLLVISSFHKDATKIISIGAECNRVTEVYKDRKWENVPGRLKLSYCNIDLKFTATKHKLPWELLVSNMFGILYQCYLEGFFMICFDSVQGKSLDVSTIVELCYWLCITNVGMWFIKQFWEDWQKFYERWLYWHKLINRVAIQNCEIHIIE